MKSNLSFSRVKMIDRKAVYMAYRDWPSLARSGFEARFELPPTEFKQTFVLGMGGSAAGGDIISGWLSPRQGVELSVFKGRVPVHDMKGTLAIACSASGGTQETIAMMQTAARRGATVVSISSGGKLEEESKKLGLQHIAMPEVVAPRYMLPFIVFSCLAVANRGMDLGCEEEAREAVSSLGKERGTVDVEVADAENPSKQLARKLVKKNPVVYASEVTRGVGIRFKNAMNENAKRHAFFDLMPDLFHNEVQSWEDTSRDFLPIFLRHAEESPLERRKTDAFVTVLKKRGTRPLEIHGSGSGSLSQLITMAYQLDMASYYVAIALGRDPLQTRMIDRLKKE
ncbi:MAG: hypothetical protein LYZ69_09085 [Nitrososphaerales archaeon]|nr:hypothetical protein [Nitrososphaerales archaeon]